MSDLTNRIEAAYDRRDRIKGDRYGWWQPDVVNQEAIRTAELRRFLLHGFGTDLTTLTVLDAGCGDGRVSRSLLECGVDAARVIGVDMLQDRVETARSLSPGRLRFETGDAVEVEPGRRFDLVTVFTLLSSVTDETERSRVLQGLWDRVNTGGWLLVFDFRFDNPMNPDVRGVRPRWISSRIDSSDQWVRTMFTPPPLARRLAALSPTLDRVVARIVAPIRSHYLMGLRRHGLRPPAAGETGTACRTSDPINVQTD